MSQHHLTAQLTNEFSRLTCFLMRSKLSLEHDSPAAGTLNWTPGTDPIVLCYLLASQLHLAAQDLEGADEAQLLEIDLEPLYADLSGWLSLNASAAAVATVRLLAQFAVYRISDTIVARQAH